MNIKRAKEHFSTVTNAASVLEVKKESDRRNTV